MASRGGAKIYLVKYEHDFTFDVIISAVIPAGSMDNWYPRVIDEIKKQQEDPVWMSEDKVSQEFHINSVECEFDVQCLSDILWSLNKTGKDSMIHESLVSDEIFVRHTSHTQSESWCKPKYVVNISPSLPHK